MRLDSNIFENKQIVILYPTLRKHGLIKQIQILTHPLWQRIASHEPNAKYKHSYIVICLVLASRLRDEPNAKQR